MITEKGSTASLSEIWYVLSGHSPTCKVGCFDGH